MYSSVLPARFVNTETFSCSYNTICLMTVKLREKKEILHFEAQVELEEHITSMALTGFSSRFGADGYDLKVGGLAIECLSYHPLFPGKVGGSILEVAGFF